MAAAVFSSMVAGGSAMAGKAHEHGAGKLNLVQEGAAYTLELELPLDTLVGFERAPRTPAERQAAEAAMARLRDPAALFRIQPATAACTVSSTALAVPWLESPQAAETGQTSGDSRSHTHADATATYTLQCQSQATPQRLEIKLFDAFPRLKRLDVQTVMAKGQGRLKLSPGSRVIELPR